jgi:quinoprotein glucose dehydrogenase
MAQSRVLSWIFGGFLALIGALLVYGGVKLVLLDGSAYYGLAGVACLLSGVLIIKGSPRGLALYAAFILATIAWSLWEAGFAFWQLLPRLAGPALLALVMALPFVRNRLAPGATGFAACGGALSGGLAVLLLGASWVASQPDLPTHDLPADLASSTVQPGAADEWTSYGRTTAGTRYSPNDQITPQNVSGLASAWSYETGITAAKRPDIKSSITFMSTPLLADGRLYICAPDSEVIALDPDSGKQIWRFNPGADIGDAQMLNCRGVSFHRDAAANGACAARIISTAIDGRLFALDAATGRLCPGFGAGGYVSLKDRMGEVSPLANYVSSPPVIIGDTAVVGGYVRDNWKTGEPSGAIRAFDVRSGKLQWVWDSGRPEDAGPMKPDEPLTRGSPNAWTVLSADPALGLVYVPMGNATPDHVGMHRTAVESKYSSSIVALEAATGKVRWHFQTTHHDLWDYDIPAQPVLFDLPMGKGSSAPAVAAVTKRGEIFILDRRNGKPLTQVVEKPAPRGTIPGEKYAPTQPYSVGFPSFNPARLTEATMWGTTPIDQMFCRIQFRSNRYDGDFTPPTTGGSIQYPGLFGVLNWGSVSIDEQRGVMMVNSSAIAQLIRLYPRTQQGKAGAAAANSHMAGMLAQEGTPYALTTFPMLSMLGIPCHGPPWGHLTAIDLKTRRILWQRPLGTGEDSSVMGFKPGIKVPGIFNIGGSVATRSGVVFIAGTLDNYLRAFDVRSGKELWKGRLPAGGQATPMTYTSPKTGRQYVVIAAGGHGFLGTTPGDYVVAFALDKGR